MLERTRKLWQVQNRHEGDRLALFEAVAASLEAPRVLYPGSFVDITASFVWPSVTYVDMDRRARQFFDDRPGVDELLSGAGVDPRSREVDFIGADYREPLDLPAGGFGLLVSLYAGFVSEYCTEHLAVGGHLLVNPSHGDAAMASIDPRYRLDGVVWSRSGNYTVSHDDLDSYLVPKKDLQPTRDLLHERGRGITYTRSPFAYLFRREG